MKSQFESFAFLSLSVYKKKKLHFNISNKVSSIQRALFEYKKIMIKKNLSFEYNQDISFMMNQDE